MNNQQNHKLSVLVQRHLALESALAASLDQLNQTTADILSKAGLRGPTQKDMDQLAPMATALQQSASKVREARQLLLTRINLDSDRDFASLKEFIRTLPSEQRARMDEQRKAILEKSIHAQANLVHNQAALFYTYDFHRKYLSGILQSDPDEHNYRPDGQQQDVQPGNFFGKTC